MTVINRSQEQDWAVRYPDGSDQWMQVAASGNAVNDTRTGAITRDADTGGNSGQSGAQGQSSSVGSGIQAPDAHIAAAPLALSEVMATALAHPPSTRTPEEWARMSEAWNTLNQSNAYRLFQMMDEYGWSAADIAYVSGQTEQEVGDYLTRIGAPAGFGGAVTLGREAVTSGFMAAIAAEEALTVPQGPRNEAGAVVDENGQTVLAPPIDLYAITARYVSQNTPEAQNFARIYGAFSSDGYGGVQFACGALVTLGEYTEAGTRLPASMSWAIDDRIAQYPGFVETNLIQRAAIQAMLDAPMSQEILRVFGPAEQSVSVPENEMGERMRAMYGTELTRAMLRFTAATDAMRGRYLSDLNAALSQRPEVGAESVPPWWVQGSVRQTGAGLIAETGPQYTEDGVIIDPGFVFNPEAFHAWYVQQDIPENRLIAQVYGDRISSPSNGALEYKTVGRIDSLGVSIVYDESGRPSQAVDNTLSTDLTRVDVANPERLYNPGQVVFLPMQGFVTSAENRRPDDPGLLDVVMPAIIVAVAAYFSAGTLGPAAASAMSGTIGATAATIAGAAIAGAFTATVSGIVYDNLTFKGVLAGALAGGLSAGLLAGFEAVAGAPIQSFSTANAIATRATVQGAVQAMMGGSFSDGAFASFASSLSGAIGTQLDNDIVSAVNTGQMTAAQAMSARVFANMLTSSIRIVANGSDAPGYQLAAAFLTETIAQVGEPQPSAGGGTSATGSSDQSTSTGNGQATTSAEEGQSSASNDSTGESPAPAHDSTGGLGGENTAISAPATATDTQVPASGSEGANSNAPAAASASQGGPGNVAMPGGAGQSGGQNQATGEGSSSAPVNASQGGVSGTSGETIPASMITSDGPVPGQQVIEENGTEITVFPTVHVYANSDQRLRREVLQNELRGLNIAPLDPDNFVGPWAPSQQEIFDQTGLLLDNDDAMRVAQLREQGQLTALASASAAAPIRFAPLVESLTGARVLTVLGDLAAAVRHGPWLMLILPDNAQQDTVMLTADQRFVKGPGDLYGTLEERNAAGDWLVSRRNVTLVQLEGGQRVALTPEQVAEHNRPLTTPGEPAPPPPPMINVPPNDQQPNTLPGQSMDEPRPPSSPPPSRPTPQTWDELIISMNGSSPNPDWTGNNADVDYGNIPPEQRWRYDRYLSSSSADRLGPDSWYAAAQRAWANTSNGNDFEQAVREQLGTPLGVGSKPVSIEGYVPDLPVTDEFGVTDIKNVVELSNSDQLRAFHRYAAEHNMPFNLIIGPRTETISEPLLNNIRETGGRVVMFDPATEELTEINIGRSGPWRRS